MASTVLDAFKNVLTIDVAQKASNLFNEPFLSVEKALKTIGPSFLISLLGKLKTEPAADTEIFQIATQASSRPAFLEIKRMMGGTEILEEGTAVLKLTVAEKLPALADSISQYSGLRKSAVEGLFKMTSTAMMGSLGQKANDLNLDAAGLAALLAQEQGAILRSLPAELSAVPAMFGVERVGTKSSQQGRIGQAGQGNATAGRYPWFGYLIAGIVSVMLISYFSKGCGQPSHKQEPLPSTSMSGTPENLVPVNGVDTLTLPDASELVAVKGGIEDQFLNFLSQDWKSKSDEELKQTWFDFDNLNFETGSANITPASMAQIRNIAAILKAFPDVKIKIGGYTDKLGNAAANQKLSQDRAGAVKAALEGAGTNPNQLLDAEGYGDKFAKMPATASDAERSIDRRIALSVRRN